MPATVFADSPERRLRLALALDRSPRRGDAEWARRLLTFDAMRGHLPSQVALGLRLARSGSPLQDRLAGARWLARAALAGHPQATVAWKRTLAVLPPLAQRVARRQASTAWRSTRHEAPAQRDARARRLGLASPTDAEVPPPRWEPAEGSTEQLARSGVAWAQTAWGHQLARGVSERPDPAEGATWWFRAAAQGDRLALANLAEAFRLGAGVPRDPALAFGFWCLAHDREPEAAIASYPDARLLAPGDANRVRLWWAQWHGAQALRAPLQPEQEAPP